MPEQITSTTSEARVRRVPRFGVFLVGGGLLGVLVALVLTYAFDGTAEPSAIDVLYSKGQVFGFLALFCIACGVVVGAVVALILDRTVGRTSRVVRIERETHVED